MYLPSCTWILVVLGVYVSKESCQQDTILIFFAKLLEQLFFFYFDLTDYSFLILESKSELSSPFALCQEKEKYLHS